MNREKWREPDWTKAFGDDPKDYTDKVKHTLANLKEDADMKRMMAYRTIALVAAICLIAAGTALALGNRYGILDFFGMNAGLTPRDDASRTISQSLGTSQGESICLTVREAAFDGKTARAVLSIEPLEREKYAIDYIPWDGGVSYINGIDGETVAEYALRTGRTILHVEMVSLFFEGESVSEVTERYTGVRENGSLIVYAELSQPGEPMESVSLKAYVSLGSGMNDSEVGNNDASYDRCEVSFDLNAVKLDTVQLSPEQSAHDTFTITNVYSVNTPFATYQTCEYSIAEESYERIDTHFDMNAVYYGTPSGVYAHSDKMCCGMLNAAEMSAVEAIGQNKTICPICSGAGLSYATMSEQWRFVPVNALGREIAYAYYDISDITMGDGERAFEATYVMQVGNLPNDGIYLMPVSSEGVKGEPIRLMETE